MAQPAICLAQPAKWWPPGLYYHLLGLGVLSIPISQAQAQSQSLDNTLLRDTYFIFSIF